MQDIHLCNFTKVKKIYLSTLIITLLPNYPKIFFTFIKVIEYQSHFKILKYLMLIGAFLNQIKE